MKMCQEHWDKLRAALELRGLSGLVAKSGEEVVDNIAAELRGKVNNYDPLMSCNWMITSEALRSGGLYLLGQKEDGSEYCPVCEAESNGVPKDDWINGPADSALKYCREQNLVPKLQ